MVLGDQLNCLEDFSSIFDIYTVKGSYCVKKKCVMFYFVPIGGRGEVLNPPSPLSLIQFEKKLVTNTNSHTTLLLALPTERVRQVWRLQVGSSERKVQVVFVISLDVLVIPSNKKYNYCSFTYLIINRVKSTD